MLLRLLQGLALVGEYGGAATYVAEHVLPLIATAVTTSPWAKETFGEHAIYTGLIYPIAVCGVTLIVGGLFIQETKDHKIDANVHHAG